ncbi:hypothetical protein BH10PSE12_BH10PSE12_22270 [soil metagenome]
MTVYNCLVIDNCTDPMICALCKEWYDRGRSALKHIAKHEPHHSAPRYQADDADDHPRLFAKGVDQSTGFRFIIILHSPAIAGIGVDYKGWAALCYNTPFVPSEVEGPRAMQRVSTSLDTNACWQFGVAGCAERRQANISSHAN